MLVHLVVPLEVLRKGVVDDEADVGFVDTHAEAARVRPGVSLGLGEKRRTSAHAMVATTILILPFCHSRWMRVRSSLSIPAW